MIPGRTTQKFNPGTSFKADSILAFDFAKAVHGEIFSDSLCGWNERRKRKLSRAGRFYFKKVTYFVSTRKHHTRRKFNEFFTTLGSKRSAIHTQFNNSIVVNLVDKSLSSFTSKIYHIIIRFRPKSIFTRSWKEEKKRTQQGLRKIENDWDRGMQKKWLEKNNFSIFTKMERERRKLRK